MKRTVTGSEPVTVDQAKEHIQGLEGITTYDTYIGSLITAAREIAEAYLWRCIVPSTFELRLNDLSQDTVKLPNPPVVAITSVKYHDADGTEQTLSSDDYRLNNWDEPGKLYFDSQPSTNGEEGNVTITYTAGYTAVPKAISLAINMMVRTLWDNREDMNNRNITELPITSKNLLNPYRCNEF